MGDNTEPDRPVVYIETSAYQVKVWGHEGDGLGDVMDVADHAADRAMADAATAERELRAARL